MARMLGRVHPEFCPSCRVGPPGPDCPSTGRDRKAVRQEERRETRRDVERELLEAGFR